jgi:hypothetical protein
MDVGWIAVPREVALRLEVDDDMRVVVRRRLFVVNGEPVRSATATTHQTWQTGLRWPSPGASPAARMA